MHEKSDSIFQRYYDEEPFIDRFIEDPTDSIDVIIPVIHTNELWESNLRSFYREIPINRLLVGDGGCIDNTIDIVSKFPRVTILNHRNYVSLGYSIRKLIEAVETEWFVYVHSDAFLPDNWFDVMKPNQTSYDWFGCLEKDTVMVLYDNPFGERPWAGAQMGRVQAFSANLEKIDDDYVYRQEDFVWRKLIEDAGYKEGFVSDTFHYHQVMFKQSPWERKVKQISFSLDIVPEEEIRWWLMQVKGNVKYCSPSQKWVVQNLHMGLDWLIERKQIDLKEFMQWTAETNPAWLPYISKPWLVKKQMIRSTKNGISQLLKQLGLFNMVKKILS